MRFCADLHVHSKFARATSGEADLEHMALWAARKGVTVLGTGDFTHPGWFAEIREKLVPAEPGLFRLRDDLEREMGRQLPEACARTVRYLLEVEISTIYKKGDRTRKVHHCLYVPDLEAAERLIAKLGRIGNLKADGRPILGLDSRDLLEITLECGEGAYLIPAHIWTPWFAALGSKSGFDSIAECYGDLTPHIFALETGLSSDPPMNWRLSQLDRFQLVSNSDAHSPGKIGREACVFECKLDYWAMRRALETGEGYRGTLEFFPEEGKYHLDGHRNCGICFEPPETKRHGGVCPACGKELTVGVMHRVAELADRPEGARSPKARDFRSLIPLDEVVAEIHRVGAGSRKVVETCDRLVRRLGSELYILEQAPLDEVRRVGSTLLAEGLGRMREARVVRQAGYDGEYGLIRLFTDDELAQGDGVSLLFSLPAASPKEPTMRSTPSAPAVDEPSSDGQVFGPAPRMPEGGASAKTIQLGDIPKAEPAAMPARTPVMAETAPNLPLTFDPLAGLDPEQRTAAEILGGALLIIAGPGTGKTRTLTHRIAHLVTSSVAKPEQCLAITFTNRAAAEMRERLEKLIPASAQSLLVTTFHGLGRRLLAEQGHRIGLPSPFRIASEVERKTLVAGKLDLSEAKAEKLLSQLSAWKRDGRAPDAESAHTLRTYDQALRELGWVDFDDLIGLAVELLEAHAEVREEYRRRFAWVSVDEFQDLDARQYRLVELLVPPDGNVCAIGDPDQSIYGFRGADARLFQRFSADRPGARVVQLRRNYRSGRAIVEGALQAIAPGSLVAGRVLEALSADDTKITIHDSPTERAEAEFIVHTIERLIGGHAFFSLDSRRVEGGEQGSEYSFADFAVLYRTETQADVLAEALARSGIPFQRHSHAPLASHPVVEALVAAARERSAADSVWNRLQAAAAGRDASTDPKAGQPPTSGGEAGAVALLAALAPLAARSGNDFARFESELALLSDADAWDPRADRVSLLTLHASKGLEFPVVCLAGCEDGLLPLRFGPEDDVDVDEERRLFFVGMTRARRRLFLCHARRRLWRGRVREQAVSPFVTAIERELLERARSDFNPREKPAATQLDLF